MGGSPIIIMKQEAEYTKEWVYIDSTYLIIYYYNLLWY